VACGGCVQTARATVCRCMVWAVWKSCSQSHGALSVRFDSWFHFHCKAMFPVRFTYIHGQCALVSDDQAESIAL